MMHRRLGLEAVGWWSESSGCFSPSLLARMKRHAAAQQHVVRASPACQANDGALASAASSTLKCWQQYYAQAIRETGCTSQRLCEQKINRCFNCHDKTPSAVRVEAGTRRQAVYNPDAYRTRVKLGVQRRLTCPSRRTLALPVHTSSWSLRSRPLGLPYRCRTLPRRWRRPRRC